MDFVEELHTWQEIPCAGNPESPGNIRVHSDFPDPEGVLDSAYAFLRRLKSFPLRVEIVGKQTGCFEEYVFETEPGVCRISASDTEGVRRGVYRIGEILREYTPSSLPVSRETFHPFFHIRISRYRFGSHTCSGEKYELDPDSDYYPEPFLDRLASEGVNAVWFNAPRFEDFFLTEWTPGNAEKKRAYYAKLRENVERCRRYGIRIFPYLVIPEAWSFDHPLLRKYPGLAGPALTGRKFFCPAFEGKRYLHDSMRQLFLDVKHLGGFLIIVQGEGAAVCQEFLQFGEIPCRKKCALSPGEIFAESLRAMYEGIRSASPEAEMFAWFYQPFAKNPAEYLRETFALLPRGIVFQYNAESGSRPVQLGKEREIGDYWQCVTEPSPAFRKFAAMIRTAGQRLSAKIQVGASHEVGSVPYVPVPALTYRKYKALREEGADNVMQVWGTGGTPGMMNFTAGRLAFTDFSRVSEEEFLLSLGRTLWGRELAPQAACAWRMLSEAYHENYPYSNMVQYFGPVADGVNWPLYAVPARKPLLPTWSLNGGAVSGDNLCECLNNHTFSEIVTLFGNLYTQWKAGVDVFRTMERTHSLTAEQKREIVRMEALEIQFGSAWRIFRFYQLRNRMFAERNTACAHEMRTLAGEETAARLRMLELIAMDPVLGYNPEARGFKYDERSIRAGLAAMERTRRELDRLEAGDFSDPFVRHGACLDGRAVRLEHFSWSGSCRDGVLRIHVECPGHFRVLDELFFAFDNDGADYPIHGHADSFARIFIKPDAAQWTIRRGEDSWETDLEIPVSALPGGSLKNVRMNLTRLIDSYDHRCSWPGKEGGFLRPRLNLAFYDPQDMGDLLTPERPGNVPSASGRMDLSRDSGMRNSGNGAAQPATASMKKGCAS